MEAAAGRAPTPKQSASAARLWVERLTLTNFRNYANIVLEVGPGPQVLIGANGAGKTNLLEAVSLLAPGRGLRRAAFPELTRGANGGGWAVAARVHTHLGQVDIGTGLAPPQESGERSSRLVRIDGERIGGSGALADYVEMVWLTPAMDGLFMGPGSERRRFLDRLILCFDPSYRKLAGRFERAMQQRNRLLADGVREAARFEGLEQVMAETGTAIAAARAEAVAGLSSITAERQARDPNSLFPWAGLAIEGSLEADLARLAAVEVEDAYAAVLRDTRERDRAAGRTLEGPHRSDLLVSHGPKELPARLCSTGEQKALLLGLVLAHAELVARRCEGIAPILLLDEITAHLDEARRVALFDEILRLGAQSWMTGTDQGSFAALRENARFWQVEDGALTRFVAASG
ncbi:MAG: DNA replication/repair protein RecF [Hyphomicrobium sp.]